MKNLFSALLCFSMVLLTTNAIVSYDQWKSCAETFYNIQCNGPNSVVGLNECLDAVKIVNDNVSLLNECSNFLSKFKKLEQDVNLGGFFSQCFNSIKMKNLVSATSPSYYNLIYQHQYIDCLQDS